MARCPAAATCCIGVRGSRTAAMRPIDATGATVPGPAAVLRGSTMRCAGGVLASCTTVSRFNPRAIRADVPRGMTVACRPAVASVASRVSAASPVTSACAATALAVCVAPAVATRAIGSDEATVGVASGMAAAARGSARWLAADTAPRCASRLARMLDAPVLATMRCTGSPAVRAECVAVGLGGASAAACRVARDANVRTANAATPGRASMRSVAASPAARPMRAEVVGDAARKRAPDAADVVQGAFPTPRAAS